MPFAYVCSTCGGDDVSRDAWAEWDAENQSWDLGAVYDFAFCHDCQGETRLIEVEIETAAEVAGVPSA